MTSMIRIKRSGLAAVAAFMLGSAGGQQALIGSEAGYADAVLADNPVGYWRFEDDASSKITVNSADNVEAVRGTNHNVSLAQPSATAALGSAAAFSTQGNRKSYIDLGSPRSLMIRDDLTVEWWQCMTHNDTEARSIISWARPGETTGDNVLYEMMLRYSSEQKSEKYPRPQIVLGHEYGKGNNLRAYSQAVIHPHKWYHIAAVRDAKAMTIRYYINGMPSGDPISYRDKHENAQGGDVGGVTIGRLGQFDSRYFQGLLDEIAVYDHALSGDRIMAHYRAALSTEDRSGRAIVVGHRGNHHEAPENTLVSYEQALAAKAPIVELDLNRSKDGVVVLVHDDTVDRTTNGSGYVKDLTLQQLKELDAGLWKSPRYAGETIPTFQEVAELCKDRAIMMLDLKADVKGDEIAKVLSSTGIRQDQVIVAPWKIERAPGLAPYLPDAPMILLHSKPPAAYSTGDRFFQDMKAQGFSGFSLKWMHLSKEFVQDAHRHGMKVHSWTINDPEEISGAVLMGIDGIITDYPEAAAAQIGQILD